MILFLFLAFLSGLITPSYADLNKTEIPVIHQEVENLPDLGAAPDFSGIAKWLNTPSDLSFADLKGKVVLVDFWTYSCINCVRTLPHVTAWYEKYKDEGFVVIGVHTPEFDFENETKNVEKALKRFNIHYPVAQDNNSSTWKSYKNKYWPAKYLVDANGHIRYTHFGEGKYEEMETAIQQLLTENGQTVSDGLNVVKTQTATRNRTPETYLGAGRMERFSSPEGKQIGYHIFTLPKQLAVDHFAYDGPWNLHKESAWTIKNSALEFHFNAGKVFLVIGPKKAGNKIKVFIDGKLVGIDQAGKDVQNGSISLDSERLYEVIDLKGKSGNHTLRLEFENEGIAVYAFTFG